jgi:hypothetical protein
MFEEWGYYAIAIVIGAILYAVGYESVKLLFDYIKQHGVISKKDKIDLSGEWHAIWQTTAEGKEVINSEVLTIKQRGQHIIMENVVKSPENKLGGYLWRGEAEIYENRYIIGDYLPREKNITSKGSLYFVLNRVGQFMVGKWVGCNYDYEFTWGFGAIAREKSVAQEEMNRLLNIRERGAYNNKRKAQS